MCELNVSLSIAIKFAMADCNFRLMVLVVIISGDDLRGNYPRGEFGVELFTSGFAFDGLCFLVYKPAKNFIFIKYPLFKMDSNMENRFKDELFKIYENKQDTKKSQLLTKSDYENFLTEILEAKLAIQKTNRQRLVLKKYDVLVCGDVQKVIKKQNSDTDEIKYYVPLEQMFDVITRAHIATGHGGRDKMSKEIRKKYANITDDVLTLFKSFCTECELKKKRPTTKGTVVRPLLTKEFRSRGQVDLIDMQSMPHGDMKFIMVYQDHLTKFCVLRPLPTKRAACVAFNLLDVFLNFGAPAILQSDNGSEFTAQVVSELRVLWPELKIVHGKPRHPQSQGSVERANFDIKDMLIAWLGDNDSANWTLGLKFVQFQKNYSFHSGIRCSPFSALFGSDSNVLGLSSSNLPNEILERMDSEADLMAAVQLQQEPTSLRDTERSTSGSSVDFRDAVPSTSGSRVSLRDTGRSTSGSSANLRDTETSTSGSSANLRDTETSTSGSSASIRSVSGSSATVRDAETAGSGSSATVRDAETTASGSSATVRDAEASASGSSATVRNAETTASGSSATVRDAETTASGSSATVRDAEATASGSSATVRNAETTASGSSATVRDAETSHSDSSANHLQPISPVLQRQKIIAAKRKGVATAQLDQAERMVKRSRVVMTAGQVGDNVTIPIPLVDRGRCDPRNIMGIIRSRDENDFYVIAVRGGVLKGKYSRNQFDICKHVLLNETDVKLDVQVSLREGVNFESKCGGQGFLKCSCSGSKRCGTKRCKCFRANVMCNSRCHSSLSCSNKIE